MPSRLTALSPRAATPIFIVLFALVAYLLITVWPAGVALGVVVGSAAVLMIAARMQVEQTPIPLPAPAVEQESVAAAPVEQAAVAPAPVEPEPVRLEAAVRPTLMAPAQQAAPASPVAETAAAPAEEILDAELVDDAPDLLPSTAFEIVEEVHGPGVRADLHALKEQLGDAYPDFARAAQLVVSTQYASAARLQRDLALPYSRARRLLSDLEEQRFVGPATGSLPRQVLMPKEALPAVERLLATV